MAQPYANHQTSIVVGEYTEFTQNTEGVSLHTYAYPDEVPDNKASVVQLPEMIKFFSEKTGVQYPYSTYSQVFVARFCRGACGIIRLLL